MKKTNYFSHDSNARNDEKILAVRMRLGAEGYGIYFMIIERLRDSVDYMSVKDYNNIAFDLRVSAEKVKAVIEDFGLFTFTEDGKRFYSESFLQRMKIKDEKSEKARESASFRQDKTETQCERIKKECERNASKEKVNNNNPPSPPKGDSIQLKAKKIFEEHFYQTFGTSYYWTAKDAGNMKQLLSKLKFGREQKKLDCSDENILSALRFFLSSINDGWIFENYSVSNLNSKYNEIVSNLKTKNHAKQKDAKSNVVEI